MRKILFSVLFMSTFLLGHAQNIELIQDINPSGDSDPNYFFEFQNKLLFTAKTASHGEELWITNGTTNGTFLLKDIYAGTNGSNPRFFVEYKGKVYFRANHPTYGVQLWFTDGTSEGTNLFKDLNPSGDGAEFLFLTYKDKLYFTANDGTNGIELWATDGTPNNTLMIKNINPTGDASVRNLTIYNDKLYFTAKSSNVGLELWESDGTTAGTLKVKTLKETGTTESAGNFIVFKNKLYFTFNDGTNGNELWVTDGTSSGTKLFKDMYPGSGSSNPSNMIVYNDYLIFSAEVEYGSKRLCRTDGTASGTTVIKDVTPGHSTTFAAPFVHYKGKIYFAARFSSTSIYSAIYETDGTTGGTKKVIEIEENDVSLMENLIVHKGLLYFTNTVSLYETHLWVTDGTQEGTKMITPDIYNGEYIGPSRLTPLGNLLIFKAKYVDSIGNELYKYTAEGTDVTTPENIQQIKLYPNPSNGIITLNATEMHGGGTIEVFNIIGVKVYANQVESLMNSTIDITNQPAGVYIVKVSSPQGIRTQTIIKK